jgi:alanyl-tRNA synthetase
VIEAGKSAQKQQQKLLAEIAELTAHQALARTPLQDGSKIVAEYFDGRDLTFIKLYAQKLVAAESNVIALIGAGQGTPALVFAQSAGGSFDAGTQLKAIVSSAGGRGGGTRDLAQAGVPSAELIPELIAHAAEAARAHSVQSNAQPGTRE